MEESATTWDEDPVKAVEALTVTETDSPPPARAPVLGKPTLRAYLGSISEEILGLYGTPRRRQREVSLVRAFLSQQ